MKGSERGKKHKLCSTEKELVVTKIQKGFRKKDIHCKEKRKILKLTFALEKSKKNWQLENG